MATKCPECKGEGWVDESEECGVCYGRGEVPEITDAQTAPNLVWVFAESEAVPSCQKTGRLLDFMAPTVEEAARNLLYTLRLADARAVLGKSGLVAYPHGIDGAHVWVFDAQTTARAQGDRIPGEEVNL